VKFLFDKTEDNRPIVAFRTLFCTWYTRITRESIYCLEN